MNANYQRTTIKHRADGSTTITIIPDYDYLDADLPSLYDHETSNRRPVKVGDEGCFAVAENSSIVLSAELNTNPEGIPGNSDPTICSLHGWRGTNNDRGIYAHGWRRVESIEPRKRGNGMVVTLSADLRPESE